MRDEIRNRPAVRRILGAGTAIACTWLVAGSPTEASEIDLARTSSLTFAVRGSSVNDLNPGSIRHIRVSITNPYPFAIRVHRIEARVTGSSKWRCRPSANNLRIGPYTGSLPLIVPARERKTAREFEVRMPESVDNACQRTTFRLAFTAQATRVGR
ncbi:MAG TPA: hypothetical protein VN408_36320 [Actinoplanes sp.]|nr:hypothetical protein [Actinoplanes sp.]